MTASDGGTYAPQAVHAPVVGPGEFPVAAVGLDHGHVYGMCEGLVVAGATVSWVYDPDPAKVEAFRRRFPEARAAREEAEVLGDDAVRLVAGAAVPADRCALGVRVMDAGKDYFTDKAPLTTLEQLAEAEAAVERTGRKYAVYYSERVHVETAVLAGQLVESGAIGRVLQVIGTGPHRLSAATRPEWFFDKSRYGGILTDIGSHQVEQVLHYTGADDATVVRSHVANHAHPEHPGLDDFGEAMLVTSTGATGYFRCDWFTPDGLQTWGDGRSLVLGTEGFIEQRKYMNIGTQDGPGHLFLANGEGERHVRVRGEVGYPFFGQLVRDCLDRTETAMTQAHAFKAAELAVRAQLGAVDLVPRG
ncbi:Gfo/Idh/MocA family oxidoreductase [Pseudokineococcus marinus]|uniref:Gfo/Idh/MocA family oxidoreductase n=1 Tax=Pseudokineococcus marinus TaxID=351215 RepID=A0A849BLC4_9ACTN|nr:Gfo/Idh/MocA family oxidoreductase [Pseudokineococcus marinus]NNH22123.1 Gfo/Idh/MocA family oxidoreductase [Pseudokineococcus marinus]